MSEEFTEEFPEESPEEFPEEFPEFRKKKSKVNVHIKKVAIENKKKLKALLVKKA